MIRNTPFISCPKEIIRKILSYLPLTRNTLESRTVSKAFKQIFDNKEYVPAVCDLLDKVRVLKETKATLKGIHYDKEDLPLLKKIEEKVAMPALVLISNGCALPVYHLIWNTPYIYPLAVLYKLVDLTIYSPAYQIGAVTCSIGLMIATAWATSKLFILEEENKIKDIEKLQKEAKNLKQYIEKILT